MPLILAGRKPQELQCGNSSALGTASGLRQRGQMNCSSSIQSGASADRVFSETREFTSVPLPQALTSSTMTLDASGSRAYCLPAAQWM